MSVAEIRNLPVSPAERIRAMIQQAKQEGNAVAWGLVESLNTIAAECAAVGDLGEAVPPGVRDVAERLGKEITVRSQTMQALLGRGDI